MNRIIKTICTLSAAVMLLTCSSLSVFADETEAAEDTEVTAAGATGTRDKETLVFDEAELLSSQSEGDLFNLMKPIIDSNNVDLAVVTVKDTGGEALTTFTVNYYQQVGMGAENDGNGILICYSVADEDWQIAAEGKILDTFTEEGFDNMTRYLNEPFGSKKYFDAFKRFANITEAYIQQSEVCEPYKDEKRVVDRGEIIPDDEEAELLKKVNEISERQGVEVVIVTEKAIGHRTSQTYIDDYYDYSGFGLDDERSGIAFLISMENRDWAISTTGKGIPYFTDAGQAYIIGEIKGYLSKGKYTKAFDLYTTLCDNFITEAKENRAYDSGHLPEHSLRPYKEVAFQKFKVICPVSIISAFLLWLIICTIEKKKLTSVSFKGQADDYIKRDSVRISERNDTYLYKNTTKRYNPPSSSSSGGGSSTHSSSSGSSHGGSSGHF